MTAARVIFVLTILSSGCASRVQHETRSVADAPKKKAAAPQLPSRDGALVAASCTEFGKTNAVVRCVELRSRKAKTIRSFADDCDDFNQVFHLDVCKNQANALCDIHVGKDIKIIFYGAQLFEEEELEKLRAECLGYDGRFAITDTLQKKK